MSALNYEIAGEGPDLVLLHGWGLNLRVWDALVAQLKDRFRVITLDLPGHGRSPWAAGDGTPAELAWTVHETLAPISRRHSLLGWSLGGQLALDLAAAVPSRVERLVLIGTTPRFIRAEDWPHGVDGAAMAQLETQLQSEYDRTLREFLELQVRGSIASVRVLEQLHAALFVQGTAQPEALAAGLRALGGNDLRHALSHISMPVLVISGEYDRVTAPAASRALAAALPRGRYVQMRRAGHAPFLSHPQQVAALLRRFLRPRTARPRPAKLIHANRHVRAGAAPRA